MKTQYTPPLAAVLTCALYAMLCPVPTYGQSAGVTLAWDSIPEPGVAGYIVYVGNMSGSYVEQYDAGNRTSFVYSHVVAGRPYYFAVAGYAQDRTVGSRSEEIFFLGGIAATTGTPVSGNAAPTAAAAPFASPGTAHRICADGNSARCFSVEVLVELPGAVTALNPTGDGRVFAIHNRRQVRVIAGAVPDPKAVLTAAPGVELSGLTLDPAFDRNHFVYVGEVEMRADGNRTLTLKRYREVAGTLAEGAAIGASLPLPATGDAPFAIDARGRIYVAMPAAVDSRDPGSPYEGMVLRFESNGTVPRESRAGSPIIARGLDQPVSLVWNSATDALWLAGSTAHAIADLSQLPLQTGSSEWPQTPASAGIAADSPVVILSSGQRLAHEAHLLAIDTAGSLLRIDPGARTVVDSLSLTDLGRDAASAALDAGSMYLALGSARATTQIVRLRRE